MRKKLPTFEEIRKVIYPHRWKIIIISFLFSLTIYLISLFTSNEGGKCIIFIYPFALVIFLLDVHTEYGLYRSQFVVPIGLMLLAILAFIAGFFLP